MLNFLTHAGDTQDPQTLQSRDAQMDTDSLLTIIKPFGLLLIVIAALIGWIRIFVSRAHERLRNWAAENGLQIVKVHRRPFWNRTGPFSLWVHRRDQPILFLRVRDREGHERDCWVRYRIFGSKVEVQWVEQ